MEQNNTTNTTEMFETVEAATIGTNVINQDRPPNWPLCNPSYVLEMLHLLKAEKCFENKAYYSTYSKSWDKLAPDRRMKTLLLVYYRLGVRTLTTISVCV